MTFALSPAPVMENRWTASPSSVVPKTSPSMAPHIMSGSVEIQAMACRKWRISRTVAERTFWYVSNESAGSHHLQAVMA
jgi:hypothetical protein